MSAAPARRFVAFVLAGAATLGVGSLEAADPGSRPTGGHQPLPPDDAGRLAASEILRSLDYRTQEQLTLTRGGLLPSGRLGLLELGAGVSFWSLGVTAAAGYEHVPREGASPEGTMVAQASSLAHAPSRAAHGGYAHVAAEWRPVALSALRIAGRRAFHWFDPAVACGFRIGGLRTESQRGDRGGVASESWLRAALTLGAGLDFGWPGFAMEGAAVHPVITVRYRVDLLTAPTRSDERNETLGTPSHFLSFGVGIRSAD